MKKVLLIEDERDIADLLRLHMEELGLALEHSVDGNDGLARALESDYELILLDLQLPGLGGVEICRRIREVKKGVPIIMLTSRAEEINKVLGLELGADDYVTKPFSVMELMARIKAVLRRTAQPIAEPSAAQQQLQFGDLTIVPDRRRVSLRGQPVELTPREYDLLIFLSANPGRPFTREQIISGAWGYEFGGYEHTVSAHINRLRSKLEDDPEKPRFVLTVRGIGYCFSEQYNGENQADS